MQGAVGFLISSQLQIYQWIFQWKKFSDRLTIDRVTVMSLWPRFWPTLYLYFGIGDGQTREPALCQLYRRIFVPYKDIFQMKYKEAILWNNTRKLLWFKITKMLTAV